MIFYLNGNEYFFMEIDSRYYTHFNDVYIHLKLKIM